jgi:delta-aminolevulinic acid dehydratase/porphobilinogen synthase
VRNFVGGIEAMVHLLKSDDIQVQAAVSQAVSVIAKSIENLAIMTDHGVCEYLARLAVTVQSNTFVHDRERKRKATNNVHMYFL